jgi:hypothetical protein
MPEGFRHAPGLGSSRVFPNRVVLDQGAWYGDLRAMVPETDVFVTTYEGYATMGEAQAARDAQAGEYGNPASVDYGQVTPVTIDGRQAFAWMVTRYDEFGAVRSMDYKAVIPYDTVTHVVELMTSAEARLSPDSLTAIVHSWGVVESAMPWHVVWGLAAVLAGALIFVLARTSRPRHDTAYRLWHPGSDTKYPTGDPRTPRPPSDGGS